MSSLFGGFADRHGVSTELETPSQSNAGLTMVVVALGLLATMVLLSFNFKRTEPLGLPFIDETTTTVEGSDSTSSTATPDTSALPDPDISRSPVTANPLPTLPPTTSGARPTTTNNGQAPTGPATSASERDILDAPQPDPAPVTTIAPAPTATEAPSTTPSVPAAPTTPPPTTAPPTTVAPTPTTAPTTASGRTLVFAEEFNTLNPNTWSIENSTYGDGNNELQCYTPEQVSVVAGKLVLRAETREETCPNGDTRPVTSGMVRSKNVTFAPGQTIEFRVKLTPDDPVNQAGLWPAVWSSGWAGPWPEGGEWDGLEVMTANNPNRSVYSIHYANSAGAHDKTSTEIVGTEPFSAKWHVIRFDYGEAGLLTWYLDGVKVAEVSAADTIQGYPAPFDSVMTELKINLALGGNPGPLDPRALPATFEVDYLRIYS